MTWDPDGIVVGEAFRDYVGDLRETHSALNHASGGGNARFSEDMHDTTSGENGVSGTNTTAAVDSSMGRRAFVAGVGATVATAATAGTVSADGELTINYDSEYAHEPTAIGDIHVAEHRPEFDTFGYVADDDSERVLEAASLASREDEDEPNNPIRIRADMIDFDDGRAFPRDLTVDDGDDEEDGSALDAEFWTGDLATIEDDGDALRLQGSTGSATFDEFTIDSGEQRRILQLVANVDTLEADATVDVEVVDAAGNSVFATIDAAADEAHDATIATAQGPGVIYQQQVGDLDGGSALDTIEEIVVTVSGGEADVTLHALNLESSSRWEFGTREYINDEDEVDERTVYEQSGYFGITSWSSLYDSDRLSDATVYDVEYPDAELEATDVDVMTEDGGRHDYDTRLHAVYSWDLPSAYDLDIELSELVDEVAHPSGRYLTMEVTTDESDVVTVDEVDDVEWTSRTSSYTDASIGDEVSLSTTLDSADVFALHEDVLLTGDEASEVAVTESALGGPTGREGGGFLSTILSVPGMILSGLGIAGLWRAYTGGS